MLRSIAVLTIITIGVTHVSLGQATKVEPTFHAGIRNSQGKHRLNQEQLATVSESLRQKTGWPELRFDENGVLTPGDRAQLTGGSATARALLMASVEGKQAIELENHSASPHVVFGCLESGQVIESDLTKARIEVRSLKLDFYDIALLEGDHELLAAFDIGMVMLHELAHATLGLKDDVTASDKVGSCVKYINVIHRELGLPERQQFAWDITPVRFAGSVQEIASIRFTLTTQSNGRNRTRDYYLRWNTQLTGNNKHGGNSTSQAMANNSLASGNRKQTELPEGTESANAIARLGDLSSTALRERLRQLRSPAYVAGPELLHRIVVAQKLPRASGKRVEELLAALQPVLAYHQRREMPILALASDHPRAILVDCVALVITTKLMLIANESEIRGIVAHELAHEYVWADYKNARQAKDGKRMREYELFCDVVAAFTLSELGDAPASYGQILERLTFVGLQTGRATREETDTHPALATRKKLNRYLCQQFKAVS